LIQVIYKVLYLWNTIFLIVLFYRWY